jgi:AhpD family alkylhydroperoxidase
MSWVPDVSEEQAGSEVKPVYQFLQDNWGFVPNYFLALGTQQKFLQDQVNLLTHVMFEEHALPKIVKEQVALVVSGINLSNNCLAARLEILGRMGIEKSMSRKLALNYESAQVAP